MYKSSRRIGPLVYGVDIADTLTSSWQVNERTRFAAASIYNIPFKDRSFDIVLCADTLEHLPENTIPQALAELGRIGKTLWMIVVCTVPEVTRFEGYGDLHITLHDSKWWLKQYRDSGFMYDSSNISEHHTGVLLGRSDASN